MKKHAVTDWLFYKAALFNEGFADSKSAAMPLAVMIQKV